MTLAAPAPVVPTATPVPGVRRLAVLRSGGIGDLVLTEPALAALRAAYPAAELTLLGAPHHRALVEGRSGPWDRFEAVPFTRGVRVGADPDAPVTQLEAWCAAQRERSYDLTLQMHGGGRFSNALLLRLGGRVSVGAATRDAPRLDRTVPYAFSQHDTLRWLEVAAAAGAPPVRLEPHLAVTAEDVAAGYALLRDDGRPLLVMHPGASAPRRRWWPDRLAAVGAALAARGARGVVVGGPNDRDLVDAVTSAAAGSLEGVQTRSLHALLGLLTRATLFLGNDSGPRHLAHALGTPTVSVSTSANLADVAPLLRTWHRVVVDWHAVCPRDGMRAEDGDCGHESAAVASVQVGEVVEATLDLWQQALAATGPAARGGAA